MLRTEKITALFPIRGQPPHIGHVMTLMKIYSDYDKIIVTISSNTYDGVKKQVILPSEVKMVFDQIFKYLPKYQFICIRKGLLERENYDDLPKFDVLVSGNPIQLEQAKKFGKMTHFVLRSKIGKFDISGTMLRKLFDD